MRKPLFATLSLIVVGLAASSPACADFANGSFENGTYVFDAQGADSLAPGSTAITGWTTFGGELAVIQNVNSFGISTPFGSHFLDLTGYHDASPYGGVQQSIATVPNVSYNLSLYLGVNDTVGANGPISVQVTAGANSTTLSANPTGAGMIWTLETWTFTASSTTTTVSIQGASTANGHLIGLDNLSVTANAVPEPASVVMLGFESLVVLVSARRRTRVTSPSAG